MPLAWHRISPPGDTFWAQAAENRRNSWFLSAAIVLALALTAYIVATVVSLRTSVGLAVAGGRDRGGRGVGGRVVPHGRPGAAAPLERTADRGRNDGSVLDDVVRELAIAADIPRAARSTSIEEAAPNAFAAGRDPDHAVLVVTRGLLRVMDREELQGVVAHELAHIRNYDSPLQPGGRHRRGRSSC